MSRRRREPRRIEGVEVESLSHEGRGVARIDGKTVFIHGALPGERVDIELTRRHRDHDEADAIAIHSPSPQRVVPRCEV